ncbi:phosphotransferase family enzyme [Saccharothrix saharensis]|uniref:Phosphotransferase family enzyme n=1 Tax=Saccharothrix saharensis TaxID=571190 RepID=A0A543JGM2_9PSEU|nr:aminoglycoside phosphotransferase family protein [Saccharothrix saharensis]TQM81989.1 phosphotransferase family enzyme [Saccharothrix saharensis]
MEGIGGNRVGWAELPESVRAAVEDGLGSPVVRAVSCAGGFSPGLASRLRLADGRSVFAKAVSAAANPRSAAAHRREAGIASLVPGPRLLWSGAEGDWVALVFEQVDGRTPALPWVAREWERVHAALVALASVPAPAELGSISADPAALSGWRSLAAAPLPGVDPWALARLDELAAWEERWAEAATGTALVHGDVRADNVLLTSSGVVFVDWPQAGAGAPWVDLALLLPSLAMQGGPDPEDVWRSSPLARGADPDAVIAVAAASAGYFVHSSLLPPPPGLPTVRAFQAAQAGPALRWLRHLLG